MKKRVLFLFLTSIAIAETDPIFPIIAESGSLLQGAFNGGGSALPDKPNGASLNPSLLYGFHKKEGKRFGVCGSYINSKNGRTLAGGAVSFAVDQQNVIGADYLLRNSREGTAPLLHRGIFTYSSQIHSDPKEGMLAWGMNITYLNSTGAYEAENSLPVKSGDSITMVATGIDSINGWNQTVTGDIGVYQVDKERGLSYSIVFKNIAGYNWTEREKSIVTTYSETKSDTTAVPVETTHYAPSNTRNGDWIDGTYKSLITGFSINRRVFGDNVLLTIPFDVRWWGFMDKRLRKSSALKNRCMVYTGGELFFGGALSLRAGYSWAPYEYITNSEGYAQFQNHHQASGGFRVAMSVFDIEMAFKKNEIGGGFSLYF